MVPPASKSRRWSRPPRAFTLAELLVVIGVMGVLLTLVAPAVTRLLSARGLAASAYTLADSLDKARAYAMANNTYVWIGFAESTGAQTETVALAAVASRDGTRIYDASNLGTLDAARLQSIDRPQQLTNVHLASATEVTSYDANAPAGMKRPAADGAAFEVGDPACVSATPFAVQVGGSKQTFSKVIEFSARGVARLVPVGATTRPVPGTVELFLLPTRGASVDHGRDAAAVQVDGLTGSTQVYRP